MAERGAVTRVQALRVLLVDTSSHHRPGSMWRYADLVAQALLGAAPEDELQVGRLDLGPPAVAARLLPSRLEPWFRRAWGSARARLARPRADIVHVLDASRGLAIGLAFGVPVVATIHDLIPALQARGHLAGPRPSALARMMIARNLRDLGRARRLLAVSRRTADDAEREAGIPLDRIVNVPQPVPPVFLSDSLPPYSERERLVLNVGSNGFYKNRKGVLRIISRVRERADVRVVMAGERPDEETTNEAVRLGLHDQLEVHADPTDADLARLYRRAALLLMPSLYEGFGWPVLEAMALGCPVVCSTAGSLPEVIGDTGLSAPVEDEAALAGHVLSILGDITLGRDLSERGRTRARGFTLDRMGRSLVDVYREAAA
jgi:glycosyltransferase involved in cell wall biosynthesis